MNYTINEIRKNVFLVEADTQYALTSMFMRPQEFYESPFEEINGKYFSVEQFMDVYADNQEHGNFSYFTDWAGFNIPSDVIINFYKTFQYDLTRKERILSNLIINNLKEGDFYVIGAYKGKNNKVTLAHEIAHAYWHLYPEYKRKMGFYVGQLDPKIYNKARKALFEQGYSDFVIPDEIQAYMSTATRKDLINHFDLDDNQKIPQTFKKFYKHFDSSLM